MVSSTSLVRNFFIYKPQRSKTAPQTAFPFKIKGSTNLKSAISMRFSQNFDTIRNLP